MFHCNGWCFPWAVTAVAGKHICLRKVVPEEIYRLVEKEDVSHLCAAPTILISMSAYPGAKDVKMNRPLYVLTAGAPPAPTVIKNAQAIGCKVIQVYGLTEVYGPHSICAVQPEWEGLSVDERVKFMARQGVANVLARHMDIVDPITMQPVPKDGETIGEIVMRGNNVMLGYYRTSRPRKKPLPVDGSTAAISRSCTRPTTSKLKTGPKTLLLAVARTFQVWKWKMSFMAIQRFRKLP